MFRKALFALAMLVGLAIPALAQDCSGLLGAGQVCGNPGAGNDYGQPATVSAIFDRALGSTRGSILERGATGWAPITPGTSGLPWVSNGAGADPAYQALNLTNGVTGVLPIANGGTNSGTQQGALNALMCVPTRAGDLAYYNGTNWVCLPGNNAGVPLLRENASGVPSWVAPGSTNGDLAVFNGTDWVRFAGNTSGTKVFTQDTSGNSSWTAPGTGTVTSVTCGTGLSGGTFTTTGTCAVVLPAFLANLNGTNQTGIADGTNTKITFNTKVFDQGTFFSTVNNRWTPPAGNVTISCQITWNDNAAGDQVKALIFKNGVELFEQSLQSVNALSALGVAVTAMDTASGTDFYECFGFESHGSGTHSVQGLITRTWFMGSFL